VVCLEAVRYVMVLPTSSNELSSEIGKRILSCLTSEINYDIQSLASARSQSEVDITALQVRSAHLFSYTSVVSLQTQLYLMCTAVTCHPVWQLFIPLSHCMSLAQRTLESGQAFSQRQLEQVCNQYSVSHAKHQCMTLPLRFRTASWLKS
jgi:hypothetical protein